MKKQTMRLLLACAVALVITGCASTGQHHVVWEYKILQVVEGPGDLNADAGEKQLNELTKQGWMLVSESTSETGLPRFTYVLKRPLKP
jgi:hypothetical protein